MALDNTVTGFAAQAKRLFDTLERGTGVTMFDNRHVTNEFMRGQGLRYLTRLFAAHLSAVLESDAAYPKVTKVESPWLNYGYPNPGGTYHYAALSGEYEYRVYGHRGTARLFDLEVWDGVYGTYMDDATTRSARPHGGMRDIAGGKSDMEIPADGSFHFILSRDERPGNWIGLPDGPAHLIMRQWYYDVENEVPGQLFIERIGATYPRPPLTEDALATSFERMIKAMEQIPIVCAMGMEQHFAGDPSTVPFPTMLVATDDGANVGFRNQYYGRGHFQCAPDEAVIMEVDVPNAEYWMFSLLTVFWESYDWFGHQISINGHQAVIDDDGKFRAVIAHRDPGVPNWLDTCGNTTGLIGGRYNWTEDVPIPRLTTVPFDAVRDFLPAGTPKISAHERAEILRHRVESEHRRGVAW